MNPDELFLDDGKYQDVSVGLRPVRLVPVQVFGAEDGYGLMDAVHVWSDCNRAEGHIFRFDDPDNEARLPGETLTVYVDPEEFRAFAARQWGDEPELERMGRLYPRT